MAVFIIQEDPIDLKVVQTFIGGSLQTRWINHPEFGLSQLVLSNNIFEQDPSDLNQEATDLCNQSGLETNPAIGILGNAMLLIGNAIW